jgi:hypothetical protein
MKYGGKEMKNKKKTKTKTKTKKKKKITGIPACKWSGF